MSIKAQFNIELDNFTLDVDLDLPSSGISALFGPSGCGKTTLLRAIAGLEYRPNNQLFINNEAWQQQTKFIPTHQRPLGYVFQEARLFDHLSVLKNVQYGLKRIPENKRTISLEQAIELLGIEHLLQRKPEHLSGGELQRVAIARALAVSPKLLLMDEPLTGLDKAGKDEILPYLESLHNELEIPVIFVSHVLEEISRLADHLVLMETGRVLASGPINEMLTQADLMLAHQHDAEAIIHATVAEHDEQYHLTYLDFSGGRITVTHKNLPIGNQVRLRIAARDVSITLQPQSATSILNIFPAVIDDIIPQGKAQVTVRLLIKETVILARLTQKSAAELALAPNKEVYVQAKSIALL